MPTFTICVVVAVPILSVFAFVDPMLSVVPEVSRSAYTSVAAKLPLPSRATIALFTSEDVAVVAEFDTLPAVAIVASLVSDILAEGFMLRSVMT